MDERYFTVKDIAERLGYREDTIRREIKKKNLRALQILGEYRITETDIRIYLKARETAPEVEDEGVELRATA